jgi:hypothetical protein
MKVLFVIDKGSNCWYMDDVLKHLAALGQIEYTPTKLINYVDPNFDQNEFGVLIYQTFPDESVKGKFNRELIKMGDELYLKFEGNRFLLDSFDDCTKNGYKRFPDSFPRIKVCASESYKKKYNTVFALPAFNMEGWFVPEPKFLTKRIIPVHCAFKLDHRYPHTIRQETKATLIAKFLDYTDFHRVPLFEYIGFLQNVRISVGCPGYGQCSHAAYHALQAGTCLLHHKSLDELKLLPHVDLKAGEDYVSFTMDTFDTTLQFLLDHPNVVEAIGRAGQKKFYEGIDLDKSSKQILEVFKNV